jgi:hypothetical protein
MGGFVSHDGTELLSLEDVERLVRDKEIEYPIVSRDEIEDRSKGDSVTKVLVVVQTTWFLLQCAARGNQGLGLTELELMTAAFALLNGITYFIWWDKPLDVQCPIRVRRCRQEGKENSAGEGNKLETGRGVLDATKERDCIRGSWRGPVKAVADVIKTFGAMIQVGAQDDNTFFVVGEMYQHVGTPSFLVGLFVTLVFGGVHCIGWSFHFPSQTERLLWRMSSIAITGVPLVLLTRTSPHIKDKVIMIYALLLLIYVLSRCLLFALSPTALRSLRPSALQTVKWTSYIPHI